jgi:sugar O-acyltransferase (sialic acid O-acetyltransferase NeuD family)
VKRLLILGAGGHGAVVAEAAAQSGLWEEISFLDDDTSIDSVLDYPVAGAIAQVFTLADQDSEIVVAIGNNRQRLSLCNEILAKGLELATVIHPNACISPSATISSGSVVFAGAVVNVGAKLGRACILNTSATVDHDCIIEDGAHISPGANLAGDVTIGECTWVGLGSVIKEGVQIGSDTITGAGSAVIADVGNGETVVGVPARRLNR